MNGSILMGIGFHITTSSESQLLKNCGMSTQLESVGDFLFVHYGSDGPEIQFGIAMLPHWLQNMVGDYLAQNLLTN